MLIVDSHSRFSVDKDVQTENMKNWLEKETHLRLEEMMHVISQICKSEERGGLTSLQSSTP